MGKAGRWLRNLFLSGRKGRKAKGMADDDCQSVLSAPLFTQEAATTSAREKRRWSFRRPAAGKVDAASGGQGQGPLASSLSHCFSEAEVHVVVAQDHQRAVAEVATTTTAAPPAASLPAPVSRRSGGGVDLETAAAIAIQSAYRSYLARKALCALRGMVKLQAMVRGQLVRRQADVTLRRMQALVDAQRRARNERLRLLHDDARQQQQVATTTPRQPPSRRSPLHPRSRKPLEPVERGPDEHVKVVEVDNGGARRGSCHSATPGRTPAKAAEPYQKVSPTPSALTDASARTLSGRTLSGRFDDSSLGSACEPTRRGDSGWRAGRRAPTPPPFAAASPSYMANTESSRAKARSQSAPRQRLSSASEPAGVASPSPSCCEARPPSAGGPRRRASLDPLDLPGAGTPRRAGSRARAPSLLGSECGSSSAVGHRGSVHAPWQG